MAAIGTVRHNVWLVYLVETGYLTLQDVLEFTNWAVNPTRSLTYQVSNNKVTQPLYILVAKVYNANYQLSEKLASLGCVLDNSNSS